MTYRQQKGRGYDHVHVTVLKFCRLSRCSASRGPARVCQPQLSYLLHLALPFISSFLNTPKSGSAQNWKCLFLMLSAEVERVVV